MTRQPILVLGDALLDREIQGDATRLCPEQPAPVLDHERDLVSPGGAALAAALLARDGHDVTLLTAIACDPVGAELCEELSEARVRVVNVGLDGSTPEKARLRSGGYLLCRLDRGGGTPRRVGALGGRLADGAAAVLVSDYGRGLAADPGVHQALRGRENVIWDPHASGPAPVAGLSLVTQNEAEATRASGTEDAFAAAAALREQWDAAAVCVTRGPAGAVLATADAPVLAITVDPVAGDPCGAGDRFAATATALLARGVAPAEAVPAACAEARDFVSAGGWHGLGRDAALDESPVALAERMRSGRRTVVATGGCFDLLHAGHVSLLQAARRLGDCLVVLLNSDSSVRRLKGPDRPLVHEDDRAAVLRSLECVDAVLLFDEDTPEEALRALRPDVFVKGADYEVAHLPEARVLDELGGRVVTVPYVEGYSTSGLIGKALLGAR